MNTFSVSLRGVMYRGIAVGRGPLLLWLHGWLGAAEEYLPFMEALAKTHRSIALDLLGHGKTKTDLPRVRYAVEEQVADLAAFLQKINEPVILIGYSMGGRLALRVALAMPSLIRHLILESASPGIERQEDRMARLQLDLARAEQITRDFPAFLEAWQRMPLFSSQRNMDEAEYAKLFARKRAQWPEGVAHSMAGMSQGFGEPEWPKIRAFRSPVSLLSGEFDTGYVASGAHLAKQFSRATQCVIAHAGHHVHAERPAQFLTFLRDILLNCEESS
ncbi:2-succinyl-6-hydroxy-2,4-cyclohexadiene-1-carboxylate synthase [Ferroacidibacillus organovorans]|uniref:2-succinyl-6-hydroxy-2,4-cyclohexadiene-1-carboxylate synthase n=1 Tax=Ferroacidibacillus organovorans TaxID=1765683 RepID=A0A853K9E4_9BACL|nr:2-succinyl-6-hydroxy-2,4-cyclohexadiene-1-carboxylate synthase [Ferroacidibacillus organovorans]KYP80979.1 hypothetical protein AYJ22_09355 [Ferroacidibacillus organovorans]OAG93483.1 hypothetical protein AYW79_10420 [Ferroacidibacillus organovorans]